MRSSFLKGITNDASGWSLVLSNLFTIIIAVWQRWDLNTVMIVYLFQNIIIGIFNVAKILTYRFSVTVNKGNVPDNAIWTVKIFFASFFTIHYGGFQFGYFSFLSHSLKCVDPGFIFLTSAVFFANHLFSFLYNYKKDREGFDLGKLMFFPYLRIIPMHVTIIFGGFIMLSLKNKFAEQLVLILFLIMKTVADIKMHEEEHKLGQNRPIGVVS